MLYNDAAVHSIPVAVHLVTNFLFNMAADKANMTVNLSSWPWPKKLNIASESHIVQLMSLIMSLGTSILTVASTFAIPVVKERQVSTLLSGQISYFYCLAFPFN